MLKVGDDDGLLLHSSKLASPKVRRSQRVERGRPSYLDITRQNVKILQSRQTWSGFFPAQSKGRGASFISACLPLNEIHAWPFEPGVHREPVDLRAPAYLQRRFTGSF